MSFILSRSPIFPYRYLLRNKLQNLHGRQNMKDVLSSRCIRLRHTLPYIRKGLKESDEKGLVKLGIIVKP